MGQIIFKGDRTTFTFSIVIIFQKWDYNVLQGLKRFVAIPPNPDQIETKKLYRHVNQLYWFSD